MEELQAKARDRVEKPYRKVSEPERRSLLDTWWENPPWGTEEALAAGPAAREVNGPYQVLARQVAAHGADGLGLSIVSMTRDVSDLLAIHVFCLTAGLTRPGADGSDVCPLPITPLFETLEDLTRAPKVVEEFLKHPVTQKTIKVLAQHEAQVALRRRVALVDPGEGAVVMPAKFFTSSDKHLL